MTFKAQDSKEIYSIWPTVSKPFSGSIAAQTLSKLRNGCQNTCFVPHLAFLTILALNSAVYFGI